MAGTKAHATWKRVGVRSGTHYVDAKGRDIPLKSGSTWILLLPKSRSAALG